MQCHSSPSSHSSSRSVAAQRSPSPLSLPPHPRILAVHRRCTATAIATVLVVSLLAVSPLLAGLYARLYARPACAGPRQRPQARDQFREQIDALYARLAAEAPKSKL